MRIAVVTLFPAMLREALAHGVVGRALERGCSRSTVSTRAIYTNDVHRTVDDRPYGGGPGMVLKVEPLRAALARGRGGDCRRAAGAVYLGADGRRFEQAAAREARDWPGLILVAGRYEGVDERFIESEIDEQWSIGDYVLTGGELPALVVIDAIARLLPGTLGSARVGGAGVVQRRPARLAALHAAGRRSTAGEVPEVLVVGRSRGDSALAPAAGAGPHVAAAARSCSSGAA